MRLTERSIKRIAKPAKGYTLTWDDQLKGLGLRTTANDVKSFIVNYRNADGTQRRATLGRFPALSATAARQRAQELLAKIHLGEDPLDQQRARRGELTFGQLVDEFAKRHLESMKRGYEVERILRTDALAGLGASTRAAAVWRRDVIELVEQKAARAPIAANRLLQAIRRLYNWAVEKDLLETNPCVMVKRPTKEQSRDRVLSAEEIQIVWGKLPTTTRMSEAVRCALRLILITAQRPGEVIGMRWDELALKAGWWEMPRERTKADRVQRVPLTSLAIAELKTCPRGDLWVFPSVKDQPLQVLALSHAVRHNREHFGLARWTPHDLRRAAASHIAGLGIDRFTLARILNHADREVTGIYDRYTYDDEKRRALGKWDRRLQAIISNKAEREDAVVSIDAGRG